MILSSTCAFSVYFQTTCLTSVVILDGYWCCQCYVSVQYSSDSSTCVKQSVFFLLYNMTSAWLSLNCPWFLQRFRENLPFSPFIHHQACWNVLHDILCSLIVSTILGLLVRHLESEADIIVKVRGSEIAFPSHEPMLILFFYQHVRINIVYQSINQSINHAGIMIHSYSNILPPQRIRDLNLKNLNLILYL